MLLDANSDVCREISRYLDLEGYTVTWCPSIQEAREALSKTTPDLIISEVVLPDGDGFSFIKQLRMSSSCLFMFLTESSSESDRIIGFELGADDYVCKPFSLKELILRIQALFRRFSNTYGEFEEISYWTSGLERMTVKAAEHQIEIEGKLISFTAAEWRVFLFLVRSAPKLLTRPTILDNCFDLNSESYDRTVDTHIKNIRAKLGTKSHWIETVRGYGYRFCGKPDREKTSRA